MKLLTAAQMRQLDRQAIEEIGIPSIVLMENAGRTTYQILRREFPDLSGPVLVIAGRGNNGGDGFVVARYLAHEGLPVEVLLLAEKAQVRGDALTNLDILEQIGVRVEEVTSGEALLPRIRDVYNSELIVDAMFGTGLNAEVRGLYQQVIELLNELPVPVLAVDFPSGLCADSGQPLGVAVEAAVTVTYGWPKLGQILPPGRDYVGRLWQVDISIPPALAATMPIELAEAEELRSLMPSRPFASHKGTYGHLLVIAGSEGKTGAATLTALAGLRVGAGLVTAGVPASLNDILEVKLTEAMTLPLPEASGARALGTAALAPLEAFWAGKSAIALGPGLGTHPETAQLVRDLVRRSPVPMVIDADGLNALADELTCLEAASAPIILTPHPGEMSRLVGITTKDIQSQRLEQAQELSRRYNVIVVLKGAQTVVAAPDGRLSLNPTGNPALASGGTGDVLTGMIGGFLAQKLAAFDAARLGVYLHGLAADQWANLQGECGLLAGELLDELPEVIKEFALGQLPEVEEEGCYKRVIS
ncbi:MAG: NAD(P)H-hydrate dehydratase [Deltaproteobacteria bacterium]|nr:NAD(P)H-hydrate dehydratase [Deltaproteobacteria bacterium]MBW1986286.1 NAD(P)H-hydrate dehydratase [Deltaproteobacteria bacterium]MBW2134327.1 NAD(P)H-hydrate dehydratase [Deltaproteobacteria bacterium]